MSVSRDVDLTNHLDFKDDKKLSSVNIPKDDLSDSYKRYHEYEYTGTASSTMDFDNWSNLNTTESPFSFYHFNTVKVEEKVCWRKLYKDPKLFVPTRSKEEWEEILQNKNFPLGSKEDRLRQHYENLRDAELNKEGYCDCCGRKFNLNNCLSHSYSLCQRCNELFYL